MEAVPRIVRQRLAHAVPRPEVYPGGHPDADVLSAFAEQALAAGEREQMLAHLAACRDCRDVLALAAPEFPAETAAAAALPAAAAVRPRWGWLPRLVTAGATLAVAVGAVVLYQQQNGPQHPAPIIDQARNSAPAQPSTPAAKSEATVQPSTPATTSATASLDEAQPAAAPTRERESATAKKSANANNAPTLMARADQAKDLSATNVAAAPAPPQLSGKTEAKAPATMATAKRAAPPTTMADVASQPSEPASAASNSAFMMAGGLAPAPTMAAFPSPMMSAAREYNFNDLPNDETATNSLDAPASAPHKPSLGALLRIENGRMIGNGFSGRPGRASSARSFNAAPKVTLPELDWSISVDGHVHRRAADGRWHEVTVVPGVFFRAVAAHGREVWVGGSGGGLFRSSDGGTQWTRVAVSNAEPMRDDVVRIQLAEGGAIVITGGNGQVWTSGDGGQHWQPLRPE
jgi:Putative zinc-finger